MNSLKSLRSDTLKHTALVFLASAFINVSNFLFHFGAIRILGLRSYSGLAAVLAIILVSTVPATVFQSVIAALVAESSAQRGWSWRSLIKFSVAVPLAVAVVTIALAQNVASFLALTDAAPVYAASIVVALAFGTACLRGVLQGAQRFGSLSWSLVFEASSNLVFGLALMSVLGNVRGALMGYVIAAVIAYAVTMAAVLRQRAEADIHFDVRRLISKSVGTSLALGTVALMSWQDLLLVRHFMSATDAGVYSALSVIGRIILFSIAFIPLVLISKVSNLRAQGRSTSDLFLAMAAIGVGLCASELMVTYAAPQLVLRLIAGSASLGAAQYLPMYSVAVASLALTTIVVNYGIGSHRFWFVAPLVAVGCSEFVAMNMYHKTIGQIISIIVAGHSMALFLCAIALLLNRAHILARQSRLALGELPL